MSAGQQVIYQAENVQLEEEIFNTLSVPRSTEYQAIVRRDAGMVEFGIGITLQLFGWILSYGTQGFP